MTKNILQFLFILFCGLILAVICNRFLDYPVSSWFCENEFNVIEKPKLDDIKISNTEQVPLITKLNKKLASWILLLEFFGHPLCFLLTLFLCFFLDVNGRCRLFRFVFSVFVAQIIVAVIKFSIHRQRPIINDFNFSSFDVIGLGNGSLIESFPSGHTALAVMIALCLASIYPRGRYLFFAVVLGVAFERIFDCRHYLSDTVVGGLISYIVWFFCYKFGFVANKFDNIEKLYETSKTKNNNHNTMQKPF